MWNLEVESLPIKIDPGAKTTGLALVNDSTGEVVWVADLQHRGFQIRDALTKMGWFKASVTNTAHLFIKKTVILMYINLILSEVQHPRKNPPFPPPVIPVRLTEVSTGEER